MTPIDEKRARLRALAAMFVLVLIMAAACGFSTAAVLAAMNGGGAVSVLLYGTCAGATGVVLGAQVLIAARAAERWQAAVRMAAGLDS